MPKLPGAIAVVLLCRAASLAQTLTPAEALDRYLASSCDREHGPADTTFGVEIDASLPKLRKQGSMIGLKFVSRTGQVVYRNLRFTGDSLVRTAVIARFLSSEVNPPDRTSDIRITARNYLFIYDKLTDWNGLDAYVFQLKPRRKRVGLFKGELWLNANSGAPFRLSGDFVKSPSVFVRKARFVQDYQIVSPCPVPARLLIHVQTRIVGHAEMVVCLSPVDELNPAPTETACRQPAQADPGPLR
jgi:hypothetical protein